jgi:EAL domain-containing protein (putative c-di-GMP-specific phosphodiesterase class I)
MDFGTSHSSLGSIKQFTFNKTEIDRSFAAHARFVVVDRQGNNRFEQEPGFTIAAEGVRTEVQLADLCR